MIPWPKQPGDQPSNEFCALLPLNSLWKYKPLAELSNELTPKESSRPGPPRGYYLTLKMALDVHSRDVLSAYRRPHNV